MQNKIGLALFGALCYNLTQGLAFTLVRMQANALGDFRTLGLVVGLPNFALVGGSFFWGVIADRWQNRKAVVVLCAMFSAILYIPLPWLSPFGLIVVRTLQSFFLGGMVQIATLFSELNPEARATLMGKLEAALGFGWGAGAFLGGFLVLSEDYGSSHPTVIFSFLLTASLGIFAVVGYMGSTERYTAREVVRLEFGEYFWPISRLFVTTFIMFFGYMFFLSISPIYLTEVAGSSFGMGIIVLLSGIVHAITAPYIGRLVDAYPRENAIRASTITVFLSLTIYSLTNNIYLITLAFLPPIYMTYFLGARAIIADNVPYQLRARAMGLLTSFSLLGSGVGSIVVGELLVNMNFQDAFRIGSFLTFISILVGWYPINSKNHS
ncbi:MAG: MFS transporter [Candidatus Marinimicrobia bacterium]|nr:MFS transporter [Candidatus Neomarinimicrobiota bacterium]